MISSIPLKIVQNRNLSILESIVWFLKEQEKMNFHEVGIMLNRDERNIWTVHGRAKKKMNELKIKQDVEINTTKLKLKMGKTSFSIYGGKNEG